MDSFEVFCIIRLPPSAVAPSLRSRNGQVDVLSKKPMQQGGRTDVCKSRADPAGAIHWPIAGPIPVRHRVADGRRRALDGLSESAALAQTGD
jgi:hypothetical protein